MSVRTIEFSPNATKLASGNWGNILKLWDLNTGSLIRRFSDEINYAYSPDIKFSIDGTRLFSASLSRIGIIMWNLQNFSIIRKYEDLFDVSYFVLSSDGTKLAGVSNRGSGWMVVWDINSGNIIINFIGSKYRISSMDLVPMELK